MVEQYQYQHDDVTQVRTRQMKDQGRTLTNTIIEASKTHLSHELDEKNIILNANLRDESDPQEEEWKKRQGYLHSDIRNIYI